MKANERILIYASPVSWAGPKRHRAPGIRFEDLPKIDVVLVTHNHYDHMDIPTLTRLVARDHPRAAFLLIGAFLPAWFQSPVHLSPEQAVQVGRDVGAAMTVPIHYGTFRLGDDGQFTAIERFEKAIAGTPNFESHFWILNTGEGRSVP